MPSKTIHHTKAEDIEHLKNLSVYLCQILREKYPGKIRRLSITTKPMSGINARVTSSFLGNVVIAFSHEAVNICTAMVHLIAEYIPTWLEEISIRDDKAKNNNTEDIDPFDILIEIINSFNIDSQKIINSHEMFEICFFHLLDLLEKSVNPIMFIFMMKQKRAKL